MPPTPPPLAIIAPTTDHSPDEIESRSELDHHLDTGSLAGLVVQGLRLDLDPPDLSTVDLTGAMFVGCRFRSATVEADLVRRGAHVIPAFTDVPYATMPSSLYAPEDLAAGFGSGGFPGMYDTVVYRHFARHGGALPDLREALAQRLHDNGIDDGLIDLTTGWLVGQETGRSGSPAAGAPKIGGATTGGATTGGEIPTGGGSIVGVMGGHAELRGSVAYRLAATLGWRLARAGRLVITGGGPGVMEAANLGAFLSGHGVDELASAIDALAVAPDFHDADRYTAAALDVRAAFPPPDAASGEAAQLLRGGLSIPTWLYGHEPANLFAARIAKYFSNAIREDTILRLARGGIVFAAGRAGTVQEVFQAATKTFYASDGASGPYVFLDATFWANGVPDLLRSLLSSTPAGDQSGLVHVTDDVDHAVELLTGSAR